MSRLKININGDTKETLVNDRIEVIRALNVAIEKLKKIHPHGRNYQTNDDPHDFKNDIADHVARVKALSDMANSISDEAIRLQDMID